MGVLEDYQARRKARLLDAFYSSTDPGERAALASVVYNVCFKRSRADGGAGSGNWGHEGRPGEVGGSMPGGGTHNRQTISGGGYTSFSKKKAAAAKPHTATADELKSLANDSKVVVLESDGGMSDRYSVFTTPNGDKTLISDFDQSVYYLNGQFDDTVLLADVLEANGLKIKYAIPESENPNYSLSKADTSEDWESRFDNAYVASSKQEFDGEYRWLSGEVWQDASMDERQSLNWYTGAGYYSANEALREGRAGGYRDDDIDNITAAIDRSELYQDTVLYRGVSTHTLENMFHAKSGSLTTHNADSIVGKAGRDDGFMSCGSYKGTGFEHKEAYIEILCPKGTKALYAEPFSKHGSGNGINWDGKQARTDGQSEQSYFSSEFETLIQRGSKLKCLSGGYDSSTGKFRYKIVVTGQDYESSAYSKNRALFT